ncbi:MAG: alpha/beta hydrolase [Eubacterium sp.]|nr:alpha/beta hydrolase [Eubacterium sp.]
MKFITDKAVTEASEIEYIRFGSGDKTLVILPGLSVQSVIPSAPAIAKQYEALCDEFTVYLFDRRSVLPDTYKIADMARDTAEAIKTIGLKDVCLFGVSQGGMIAIEIAARYPGLVNKMVLGSTACRIDDERIAAVSEWIELAKKAKSEELYLTFAKYVYPESFYNEYRKAFAVLSRTVTDSDLERFTILAEGIKGLDLTENVKKIECPVLVIGDSDDAVLGPDASEEIAELLKNGSLYMYSGYGHAVYDMAPDYIQRLLSFFTRDF